MASAGWVADGGDRGGAGGGGGHDHGRCARAVVVLPDLAGRERMVGGRLGRHGDRNRIRGGPGGPAQGGRGGGRRGAAGRLVVFPTETVYGIAARPDDPVRPALFAAKGRPADLNLPVLVADTAGLGRGRSTPWRALASAFWPGGFTFVLERTQRSRDWSLGDRPDTVAVRVPDHPLSPELLRLSGALATTSANPSGRPPSRDATTWCRLCGEDRCHVGASGNRQPREAFPPRSSTAPGSRGLLRAGPIPEAEIRRVAEGRLSGEPSSRLQR